jgi:ribose 1,5-bisphosphokinase PhnN
MRLPHDLTRLGPVLAGKDPLNHLERAQTANQHRLNILRRKHPRRARIKRRIDLIQRPSR